MNAEISAYSSGDLLKYEYLTKKDLKCKPDAFEQTKFEYSPLSKVFTDGLDKSDRNEVLLKRLKNIEDRNNNQLLAMKNIPRPAIKDENNVGFRSDDDVNDEYQTIQDFKQELIDKNILRKGGVKKFDKIVDKWKQTKDKKIAHKNVGTKVDTKKFDIYNIFQKYLNKDIDYDRIDMIERTIKNGITIYKKTPRTDKNERIINNSNKIINAIELFKSIINNNEFVIPGEYNAKLNNNIDLGWMIDKDGYEEIAEETDTYYMKGKNNNELKLIKDFITIINNGTINNKFRKLIRFRNEFRKLKQKVTNDILRQYLIKYLEKYLFGEDIESKEKYEESMAERVKTTRDTQRTFAPSEEDYSAETDEYLKYMEEQEKDRKKFSDEYDSNGWSSSGSGLKILTNKTVCLYY